MGRWARRAGRDERARRRLGGREVLRAPLGRRQQVERTRLGGRGLRAPAEHLARLRERLGGVDLQERRRPADSGVVDCPAPAPTAVRRSRPRRAIAAAARRARPARPAVGGCRWRPLRARRRRARAGPARSRHAPAAPTASGRSGSSSSSRRNTRAASSGRLGVEVQTRQGEVDARVDDAVASAAALEMVDRAARGLGRRHRRVLGVVVGQRGKHTAEHAMGFDRWRRQSPGPPRPAVASLRRTGPAWRRGRPVRPGLGRVAGRARAHVRRPQWPRRWRLRTRGAGPAGTRSTPQIATTEVAAGRATRPGDRPNDEREARTDSAHGDTSIVPRHGRDPPAGFAL